MLTIVGPPRNRAVGLLALGRAASAQEARRLEEEGYICEELESKLFWRAEVGTAEEPCVSMVLSRNNTVDDDGVRQEGEWNGDFRAENCVQSESVTRYLAPVSVGAPCEAEVRTTTFNSSVSCSLAAAPEPGECSSTLRTLWSQLSGTYTFEVCREIASRSYWRNPVRPSSPFFALAPPLSGEEGRQILPAVAAVISVSKPLIKHASVPAEPAKRQHRRLHRRNPDPLPRERRGVVRVVGGQPLPRVHGGADGVRDARPVARGRGDLPDALRRRAASTDAPYGLPECRGVVWRYAQILARNMSRIHALDPFA